MSVLQDLDLSQYISKENVHIENVNIENCKITGIKRKFLIIYNSNFKNVIFENSFYEVYVSFKESVFTDCIFRDSFEGDDLELVIHNSQFTGCRFENISYSSFQVQSDVTNCKFINCSFDNIMIKGDLCFTELELQGGEINGFNFYGNQIMQNNFSNMKIENANLRCAFARNKMNRIAFKNIKLNGYNNENVYVDCDTSGFDIQ